MHLTHEILEFFIDNAPIYLNKLSKSWLVGYVISTPFNLPKKTKKLPAATAVAPLFTASLT